MKGNPRPLNNDEIRRVSNCFDGVFEARNRCLFMLGVSTGGRISELLSLLRLGDVYQNARPVTNGSSMLQSRGLDNSESKVYCPRKFRPLSNIRLCYNDNLYLKGAFRWRTKRRKFTAKFKAEVVREALRGESSQAELCRRYNLSENQVSTWKRQFLENAETFFGSPEQHADASSERIAQLEQIVGRLTLALEIQKKALTLLD